MTSLIIPFSIALLFGCLLGWLFAHTLHKVTIAHLKHIITTLNEAIIAEKNQYTNLQDQYLQINKELSTALANHAHLEKQITEQGLSFTQLQAQMTSHFKNIAHELLEEKNKKFTDHSQLQIEQLLTPLNEKISSFEKQVAQSNQEHLARNVALRTELKQLHELNLKITHEAENLTNALKGSSKLQGGWGEFILENILDQSGLVKNREYLVQPSLASESGQRFQPDIIITLPNKQHIIIDAKVSLTHYEQFFNTADSTQRPLYLKQHIHSIRRHIKTLSEKNYQSIYNLQGLDFVLMFIPIEPAFTLAVQEDMALFNEAYTRNIVIVSPSNLMATLRTIANLWRQEYQSQNALEIAIQGGALYDKFVAFMEDLKSIGRQLDLTQKNYTEATKKLYDGKGSLVSRAEKMKKLGARTSKVLLADQLEKQL